MKFDEFKTYVEGERPAFSQRVKITEKEFKQHIEHMLGLSLSDYSNKTFAHRINQLRRFYFKVVID